MANAINNVLPKILARGLLALREQAVMPRIINMDYSTEAANKGDTIDVPIPSALTVSNVTPSNVLEAPADSSPTKVQIALNNWRKVNFHLDDKQVVEIDRNAHFMPMQMSEAVRALANDINGTILDKYKGVYGMAGTPGATPFASNVEAATGARQVLNEQLCPRDNRRMVLDFAAEAKALALPDFQRVQRKR